MNTDRNHRDGVVSVIRCALFCLILVTASNVLAQTPAPVRTVPADANKFAVIIIGPGGEEAYAQQFAQWSTDLTKVLNNRFGFGNDRLRVLSEKPQPNQLRATAEEVRRTFAALKSDLTRKCFVCLFNWPRQLGW